VLGALAGGVAKVAKSRRGGDAGGSGGSGGSGRPSPTGGPTAPTRAASVAAPVPETAEAYGAPAGGVRTLVSVPPLPRDDDVDVLVDFVVDDEDDRGDGAGVASRDPAADAPSDVAAATRSDATDADQPDPADRTWLGPQDDGQCPPGHPVKANDNSGIYHVPGGRFYDRTVAERCYATPAAAEADGYRAAKA